MNYIMDQLAELYRTKTISDEEILEKHYLEIYGRYCIEHPEEINSDFILEEDANEDYLQEIIEEMRDKYGR